MTEPVNGKPQSILLVISAPSGAGKTTLCNRLLQEFPNLVHSISSTTRAPRGKETHGKEYFFLKKDEFEKAIQNDEFVEWANVHGNYYGTSKAQIEDAFAQKKSVLLDIDVQGADLILKAFPNESYRIFIAPPSLDELERRLRERGTDSEETIQKRVKNAQEELKRKDDFDTLIVNENLEQAYGELKAILKRKFGFPSKG